MTQIWDTDEPTHTLSLTASLHPALDGLHGLLRVAIFSLAICCLLQGCSAPRASLIDQDYYCAEDSINKAKILAFDRLISSADRGNREAQSLAAELDTRSDARLYWWRRAAELGAPVDQQRLGWALFRGEGLKQNRAEGIRWLEEASNQGDVDSQFLLGTAYFSMGEEDKRNYPKAYIWLLIADRVRKGDLEDKKLKSVRRLMTTSEIREATRLANEWKPSAWHSGRE